MMCHSLNNVSYVTHLYTIVSLFIGFDFIRHKMIYGLILKVYFIKKKVKIDAILLLSDMTLFLVGLIFNDHSIFISF
jgi:hypothetical protein